MGTRAAADFLPPIEAPRRMWAASDVRFLKPIAIGDEVARTSTIASIEEKRGSSGPLVFVGVDHVLRVGGEAESRSARRWSFATSSPTCHHRQAPMPTLRPTSSAGSRPIP